MSYYIVWLADSTHDRDRYHKRVRDGMTLKNYSKGTVYEAYCDLCKHNMKIEIPSQHLSKPTTCPFCGSELVVEKIKTRQRL